MLPALAGAQGEFAGGSEYAVAGQLRADQAKPRAAISHEGGYLVWQDNVCDRDGLGNRAVALNANLVKSGPLFRINTLGQHDQENPRVALLRGGGAVFVWQGGRPGFQKVYARFLSSGGSFVTGDVRVSGYEDGFQINPDVATLADGSVIVIWASSGQDGSYQGVYGQRFASNGGKIGNEFRINQFTSNNQRSPSVAALTNGNYVVAWVSELQRASSSVDIYARVFTSGGSGVTSEFPVNLSTSNTCANPSVSASILGGGFAVAWSPKRHVHDSLVSAVSAAHPRTVYAAIARDGDWWNLNYAHQLSHGARRIATTLVEPKLKNFKAIATNLLQDDEFVDAHGLVQQTVRAVETGFDGVVRKSQLVGQSVYSDQMRIDKDFWTECGGEWRRGKGYRERINAHNEGWFEETRSGEADERVLEVVTVAWDEAIASVRQLLAQD